MNNDTIRELIGPYVDDDLPTEAKRRVEEAILSSPELAWEVQSLKITRERLRTDAGEVVASDAFRARTLRVLYADNPHLQTEDTETKIKEAGQFTLPIKL
jgi:anti-sigma factor RsiW